MQKEIIIRISIKKSLLGLIGCLLFVIICIHSLDSPKMAYISYAVINILGIIFFSIAVLVFIYLLFFKRNMPILIINAEGFVYTGKYVVCWGQVKAIEILNVDISHRVVKFIRVELKNIQSIRIDYTKKKSKLVPYTHNSKKANKYMTTVLNNLIGKQQTKIINKPTTIDLSLENSTYKPQKVLEIMQQYKAEYDRLHPAANE